MRENRKISDRRTGIRQGIRKAFLCLVGALIFSAGILPALQPAYADGDPGNLTPEKKAAAAYNGMKASSLRKAAEQNAAQRKVVGYGIDVSYWQGNIDWAKVKADGVSFAFIRVAYRTYGSSGTLNIDTKAKKNIEGAQAVGIKVGVYCFSTAISKKEALAEARLTLEQIKGYKIELPVVYDCEGYTDKEYRNYAKNASSASSVKKRTDRALAFMEYVESQGYESMIYNSAGHFLNSTYWDMSRLKKYGIWMAQYYYKNASKGELFHDFESLVKKPSWYTGDYRFWQGTSSGKIDGIKGGVDLDIEYASAASSSAQTALTQTSASSSGETGWRTQEDGGRYYLQNGARVTGLKKIDGVTCYFNAAGILQHGDQQIGGSWYYFAADTGAMLTESFRTVSSSGKTWKVYYDKDGVRLTGLHKIGGKTYYFRSSDGSMLTSSFKTIKDSNGKKYKHYFGSNGHMYTGSHKIKGYRYYFDKKTGAMVKKKWMTFTKSNGKKYRVYYDKKGRRVTGMRKIGRYYYYFTSKAGAMVKNKWKKVTGTDGKTYKTYFGSKGRRASGWLLIGKKWYQFDKSTGKVIS